MEVSENLRNKYQNHSVIKPLIRYCKEQNIAFEIMKESRIIDIGLKSFTILDKYYLFIGKELIRNKQNLYYWSDLFELLTNAYKILGISYHENLVKAARSFNRAI